MSKIEDAGHELWNDVQQHHGIDAMHVLSQFSPCDWQAVVDAANKNSKGESTLRTGVDSRNGVQGVTLIWDAGYKDTSSEVGWLQAPDIFQCKK